MICENTVGRKRIVQFPRKTVRRHIEFCYYGTFILFVAFNSISSDVLCFFSSFSLSRVPFPAIFKRVCTVNACIMITFKNNISAYFVRGTGKSAGKMLVIIKRIGVFFFFFQSGLKYIPPRFKKLNVRQSYDLCKYINYNYVGFLNALVLFN